eukprot:scaffold290_cov364-Prasinococcus_capsulatus_cf.AAC.3
MSPVNAGFIAAVPGGVFYDRFRQAMAHGPWRESDGWGGNFTSEDRKHMDKHVRDPGRGRQ